MGNLLVININGRVILIFCKDKQNLYDILINLSRGWETDSISSWIFY